jgi:hypothetical protein
VHLLQEDQLLRQKQLLAPLLLLLQQQGLQAQGVGA